MAATQHNGRARLLIHLEPTLRREIERAASHSGISVEDYIACVLRDAVSAQPRADARLDTTHRPAPASRPVSSAQAEDRGFLETAALAALRRKCRLALEDVVGVLPPLGLSVEEMIRRAKDERAVRAAHADSDNSWRR